MSNLFDTSEMALGYANSRPAVHPLIIAQAAKYLPMDLPVDQALDVGCGAGLSTRALQTIARRCMGIDPSKAMVECASSLVPLANFVVGRAESLPVSPGSMDLMSAAGSLNYADLKKFFTEADRVLRPGGALLVYDFHPGKRFHNSDRLERWFDEFLARFPMPADSAHEVNPEILESCGSALRVSHREDFEVGLLLDQAFYLNYMMSETNVACAIQHGRPAESIRTWCAETLAPVFQGSAREVLFCGYFVVMSKEIHT